jgi:hypothetical protein
MPKAVRINTHAASNTAVAIVAAAAVVARLGLLFLSGGVAASTT